MNLLALVQERFRAALNGLVDDVEPYVAMVKPAQDAKHGDYQANCAMTLAKALGQEAARRRPGDRRPPRPGRRARDAGDRRPGLHQPAAARPTGWPRQLQADGAQTTGSASSPPQPPQTYRHRLQLAERRQADARRPPAQHDHRRRPDAAAALPRPHGHHRQPPRRLGHAVRHAPVRLQELPRRGGLRRPTRCASWRGCTSTSAS